MIVRREGGNPLFGLLIILFIIIMIWLAITAVRGIFAVLSWLALPLFILALILNYQVVIDYFRWLWRMLRHDTIRGVMYTGLSLLAYPFVSAYLAYKAYRNNRWNKTGVTEPKGEYIRYKELDRDEEDEDFLELRDIEVKKDNADTRRDTGYDDIFE